MSITISETAIQSIFDDSEFSDFKDVVKEVCEKNSDIQGVLITGSLTQRLRLPDPDCYEAINDLDQAYSLIENKSRRRRIFPNKGSDLDIWVCLKDPKDAEGLKTELESKAIELLCWLSANQHLHNTKEWITRKKEAFDAFYKKAYLYSNDWKALNPENPWMAASLKRDLISSLYYSMPSLVARINHNFEKKVADDFLEVRAYPESTFNLRVEELFIDGKADKTPFPFILDRLLDLRRNCFVLYVTDEGKERMIYPLNPNGEILGKVIEDFIYEP